MIDIDDLRQIVGPIGIAARRGPARQRRERLARCQAAGDRGKQVAAVKARRQAAAASLSSSNAGSRRGAAPAPTTQLSVRP